MVFLFAGVSLFFSAGNAQTSQTYDTLNAVFKNPPSDAHPRDYWWCLNGDVDTVRAKQEFRAM